MYRDATEWANVRHRVLVEGVSQRCAAREFGISRNVIRKMLCFPHPQPYGPRSRAYPKLGPHTASIQQMVQENATLPPASRLSVHALYERIRSQGNYQGSYGAVKDYVRSIPHGQVCIWDYVYEILIALDKKQAIEFLLLLSRADPPVVSPNSTKKFFAEAARLQVASTKPDKRLQRKKDAFEWMRAVQQKEVSPDGVDRGNGDLPEISELLKHAYNSRLSNRNRAMVILARHHGISAAIICLFLNIHKKTCRKYVELFKRGGTAELFAPRVRTNRKTEDDSIKEAVFSLLHEPPSKYGINRTSWKMSDLERVLRDKGKPACRDVIRKITRAAGYRWRKARTVLTSNDPAYSDKLDRIRTILASLGPDEAFFSIDEYGPFAVKMKPGLTLTGPGEQRIVPQFQKSRGCLLMTAALELSANQVTHFYSARKNTAEMIRMMDLLSSKYAHKSKIYLSWDAASWHLSKELFKRIDEHNNKVAERGGPLVETAPLPVGAQFLNVIESIFSGMARAIIHNSDYGSLDDAKSAIDRYFADRNEHFKQHPQRAGKKIWKKERELPVFSSANNCKDPRYR